MRIQTVSRIAIMATFTVCWLWACREPTVSNPSGKVDGNVCRHLLALVGNGTPDSTLMEKCSGLFSVCNYNDEFTRCVLRLTSPTDRVAWASCAAMCPSLRLSYDELWSTIHGATGAGNEAIDELHRISSLALEYTREQVRGARTREDCSSTFSAPPMPPLGACCSHRGGVCSRGSAEWSAGAWGKIGYAPPESHYCSYSIEREEYQRNRVTFGAYCDIDCDGVYSTFQKFQRTTFDDTAGPCSVESLAGYFMNNETE